MKMLRRMQDSIRTQHPQTVLVRAGAFAVTVNPESPIPWYNDAVPEDEPTPSDVEEMVAVFREYRRRPRLEFLRELWPAVPALLEEYGFRLKDTQPALALAACEWRGHSSSVDVRRATPEDAGVIDAIGDVAFAGDGPDPGREASIRESLAAGRSVAAIAFDGETAIGSGRIVGRPDVREVVSIGTLPEYRRRGVATAVTARLLDDFFAEAGEIAWLTATPEADSLYRRLGFLPVATQCCYVLD